VESELSWKGWDVARRRTQQEESQAASAFTPKRGRPTAEQAAAISKTIMDAATDLFLTEGFEGASTDAIAARAGVPKSTLYKRFPDKKALLRAVLKERVAAWSSVASQRNWMLTDSLEQRLKLYATWMLTWSCTTEVRAFARLAASAWNDPDEIANRHDVIGYTNRVTEIEREIRELGPKEGVVAQDPRRVAVALMAMLAGWLEQKGPSAQPSEAEAVSFAHTAVDLLLNGKAAW
jgi:AcrR family transcriptional regulator